MRPKLSSVIWRYKTSPEGVATYESKKFYFQYNYCI